MNGSTGSGLSRAWILVWDLPARVSHWGFSLSLTVALVVGFKTDPESSVFKVHILAGLLACWFLFVRLVMGFVGSRPVRWTAFFKAISKWREYAAELRAWRAVERVGLNAGSALFALMIYVTVLGVVCTGFAADFVETWHGRLAYACVVLIGAHLAGLLAHAFRHREASPLAMIHGRVLGDAASALTSQRSGAGWLLIALGAGVASLLWVYFDEPTSVLRIPFLPEIYLPVIQKG